MWAQAHAPEPEGTYLDLNPGRQLLAYAARRAYTQGGQIPRAKPRSRGDNERTVPQSHANNHARGN